MARARVKFGSYLRARREGAGLSLRGLAKKAKVGYTRIQGFETGKYSPTLETLEKLARAFEQPVSVFLEVR